MLSILQSKILPKRLRGSCVLPPSGRGREIHDTSSAEFSYGEHNTYSIKFGQLEVGNIYLIAWRARVFVTVCVCCHKHGCRDGQKSKALFF